MFAPKPVGGFGANPAAAAGDFGDAGGGFNAIPAAAAGGFGAAAAAAGGFGAAGGGLFAKPAAAAGGFGAMPAAAAGGFGAAAGGFGGLGVLVEAVADAGGVRGEEKGAPEQAVDEAQLPRALVLHRIPHRHHAVERTLLPAP